MVDGPGSRDGAGGDKHSNQAHFSSLPKTTQVRDAHIFDQAALEKYLQSVLPEFSGPITVTQFASGQSNPTFLLSTPGGKYVLRKKPPGDLLPSAHQIEREYKIMAALKESGVAVPEVLHLCQDAAIIGTSFFVMRYVEGRIFSHPSLPGVSKSERAAIYGAACAMLALLHKVDFEAVGLADYGRREAFVARQVARWTKQYAASKTDQIDEMDKVIEWLSANIPGTDQSGRETSLIHGDYRLDNMIFHPGRPEILAVLDWELSTLGNPLSDLGYFSVIYHLPSNTAGLPGLAGLDLADLGIPTELEFADNYLRHMTGSAKTAAADDTESGGKVGRAIKNFDSSEASDRSDGFASGDGLLRSDGVSVAAAAQQRYFVVFSLFRLAAIAQGVYSRAKQGVASAANAEAVGRMARPCAQLAWSLAKDI